MVRPDLDPQGQHIESENGHGGSDGADSVWKTLLPTKPFEKDDEHSLNVDCGHQRLMSQITEYQAPRT